MSKYEYFLLVSSILAWIYFTYLLFKYVAPKLYFYLKHIRSRNTLLRKGQIWRNEYFTIQVGECDKNGNYLVRCGNTCWRENESSWKQRVTRYRLYLESES